MSRFDVALLVAVSLSIGSIALKGIESAIRDLAKAIRERNAHDPS